jgi:hypothetical protein
MLSPICASAVVVIVFILLVPESVPPSAEYATAIKPALIAGSGAIAPPSVLLMKPFAWTASAFVLTVLFIATVVLSIYTIYCSLERSGENRRRIVMALAILLPALISFILEVTVKEKWTIAERSLQNIMMKTQNFSQPPFTMTMNVLAMWETLMLVLALSAICVPFPTSSASPGEGLIRRKSLATALLFLGAFTLTTAVVQINLLISLPGNAAILGVSEQAINTLASGTALVSGTFFTLLLAAMYVPVVVFLGLDTNAVAMGLGSATSIERQTWLEQNGLASTWRHQAARLAALLCPILTGWLGEPITRALSSVFGR